MKTWERLKAAFGSGVTERVSVETITVTRFSLDELVKHGKELGAEIALRDVASRKGRAKAALPDGQTDFKAYAKHLIDHWTSPA